MTRITVWRTFAVGLPGDAVLVGGVVAGFGWVGHPQVGAQHVDAGLPLQGRRRARGCYGRMARRRSDAGVIRLTERDVTALVWCGEMYGVRADLLGAVLGVGPAVVRCRPRVPVTCPMSARCAWSQIF